MDMERMYQFLKENLENNNNVYFSTKSDLEIELGYTMEGYEYQYNLQVALNKLEKEHLATDNWGLPCLTCNGTGVISFTENGAPYGAGYWPMDVSDICPDCLDSGFCPGCHLEIPENLEEQYKCSRCDYNIENY